MCRFPGGCDRKTADNHHLRGKIGELLTDTRYFFPLCRHHHDWVRDHPVEARALNLLPPVGQWNTTPEQHKRTLDKNATLIQSEHALQANVNSDGLYPNGAWRGLAADEFRISSGVGTVPDNNRGAETGVGGEA